MNKWIDKCYKHGVMDNKQILKLVKHQRCWYWKYCAIIRVIRVNVHFESNCWFAWKMAKMEEKTTTE